MEEDRVEEEVRFVGRERKGEDQNQKEDEEGMCDEKLWRVDSRHRS